MNWSKAKNILIIAFALINVFLGFVLISMNRSEDDSITDEYRSMVISLLNDHDIELSTIIPENNKNIPEITVKYEIYNPNDIRYKSFSIPEHNKSLSYESSSTEKIYNKIDTQSAEKLSLEFINQNGFNNNDIKLWSISYKEDTYLVEYKQQYNDMTFDDGFMKLYINKTGVMKFERQWLIVEAVKYNSQKVIEPYKSLMLAMDKLPKNGTKIIEMILTYKLNVNDTIDTQWFNIDHGTLSPYWKIRFEDNTAIDIKAYQ